MNNYSPKNYTSLANFFGDEISGQESYLGHEFLKKIPSWIWSDICVVGDSVIYPGEKKWINVLVKKDHFPKVEKGWIFQWFVKGLSYSTRSCFAQSGVFVMDNWSYGFHNSILHEVNNHVDSILEIPVKNIWYTHIKIIDGVWMLRLFHLSWNDKIRWSDLYSLIKSEKFSIDGKYNENWFLIDLYGNKLQESECDKAENLVLVLSENRYKSEGKNGIDPLIIKSKKDLIKILYPLEENEKKHFIIWETPHVSLGKWIYGKIFTMPYSHDDPFPEKVIDSRHEPSPLIDEGFSGPIRTEISGGNNYVEMEIFVIK